MPPIEAIESDHFATIEVFRSLSLRTDEFEGYPNAHATRIAAIADQLAKTFSLGTRDRFSLRVAALAHDLGHPPFAHVGEKELDRQMQRFGCRFEHNRPT